MVLKVNHSQSSEVFYFTSSEFVMYLVGLCQAGRNPVLHISSVYTLDGESPSLGSVCDYSVIIDFNN